MKKMFLMAIVAAAAVSVSFSAPPSNSPVTLGEELTKPETISCKDITKAQCIKGNGCNQKTKALGEQNRCIKSCEEIAESACNR